jgi:hypothetical protein
VRYGFEFGSRLLDHFQFRLEELACHSFIQILVHSHDFRVLLPPSLLDRLLSHLTWKRLIRSRVVEAHWLHDYPVCWLYPATQYLLFELCGETQVLGRDVLHSNVLVVSLLAAEA